MKKLAIVTTHPIQYNAPFFKKLASNENIELTVFYTWPQAAGQKLDPDFGKSIKWDVPLLEGYNYIFVNNISKKPGSHHKYGIICPTLIEEIKSFQPNAILFYGWNFHAHLRAMKYFKSKIPVWFRGDSTLLDYNFRSIKDLLNFYFNKNQLAVDTFQAQENNLFKQRNNSELKFEIKNQKLKIKDYFIPISTYIKFKLRKYYLTYIYKYIDKAFYVGTHNKNYFITNGVKEDQLIYMPHTIDDEFFHKDEEAREKAAFEWRRSMGITDQDFVVIFAGKFEPKKNLEFLLNSIIELNENYKLDNVIKPSSLKQIHLILVGNGILEPKLHFLSKDKPYIHFIPFQNQSVMPVVYRLGNVFCLPSQGPGETWGLSLNEALECNRKLVASDKVGGAIDLITNDSIGAIFLSGNKGALKNALINSWEKINIPTKIDSKNSIVYNVKIINEYLS